MRALIAFDKYKDALTARETCQIAAECLKKRHPDWEIETAPLADGGDGFCDTLTGCVDGLFFNRAVTGPLGKSVQARFGIALAEKLSQPARDLLNWKAGVRKIAVIELAESSGISLTPVRDRSPWETTTAGLGEAIQAAITEGAQSAIVGLGGSATHDLGLGALWKLGYRFIDKSGREIDGPPVPDVWPEVGQIDTPEIALPHEFEIRLACDVENPLLGPSGAVAVFGPQKGLKPHRYDDLESATKRMAKLLCDTCGQPYSLMDATGAGAAGGAAFGLQAGLGAAIVPGFDLVKNWIGLGPKFERAELVITGEGRFDASSLQGKGPGALALEAVGKGKTVRILAGSIGELPNSPFDPENLIAISPPDLPIEAALKATSENLRKAIRKVL